MLLAALARIVSKQASASRRAAPSDPLGSATAWIAPISASTDGAKHGSTASRLKSNLCRSSYHPPSCAYRIARARATTRANSHSV